MQHRFAYRPKTALSAQSILGMLDINVKAHFGWVDYGNNLFAESFTVANAVRC